MLDFLYSFVALVSLIAYLPQINRLWTTTSDCRDISIPTWILWTVACFISVLYGIYELADLKFTLTMGVNFACNFIIVGLTVRNRWRYSMLQKSAIPIPVQSRP